MESKFRNIRKIVQHLRHPYRLFFYLALLGIIYMGLDIVEPVLAGHIMDALLSNEVETEIWQLGLLWLAIFILKYAVSYEKMRIGLFSMLSGMENIQLSIFQTILSAPLAFFNQFSVGYLMARQTDDVFNLEGMMPHHLVEGLLAIAESFVILSCMFYLNVWLGIGTVLLKCLDLFSNFYFPLKELYKEHNEARAIASSELQDVLKNILLIKAAGKEKEECQRFQECLKQYYGTWNKRDEINYIRSLLTRMSEDASYMIIIVLGGVSMYYGKMTIGEITAFLLFYKKLSSAFVGAVPLIPLFKIGEGAMERVDELKRHIPERKTSADEKGQMESRGKIELQNVKFSYNNQRILQGVSMSFKPGEITAIVGKSGAGKSTIIKLLLGLYQVEEGKILWNGNDVNQINGQSMRSLISYIPQDAPLFHRTLRENILYEAPDSVSDEDVSKVIARTGIQEMQKRFEQKEKAWNLETMVSGGERQRINLARALLKNGSIYIFDEATSALDTETEKIVQQTLRELSRTKVVIIISHRLSSVRKADKIYVLDEGSVQENGSHEELMKKKGRYYRLFEEQVKKNDEKQIIG